jgi:hypothetical protein
VYTSQFDIFISSLRENCDPWVWLEQADPAAVLRLARERIGQKQQQQQYQQQQHNLRVDNRFDQLLRVAEHRQTTNAQWQKSYELQQTTNAQQAEFNKHVGHAVIQLRQQVGGLNGRVGIIEEKVESQGAEIAKMKDRITLTERKRRLEAEESGKRKKQALSVRRKAMNLTTWNGSW